MPDLLVPTSEGFIPIREGSGNFKTADPPRDGTSESAYYKKIPSKKTIHNDSTALIQIRNRGRSGLHHFMVPIVVRVDMDKVVGLQ